MKIVKLAFIATSFFYSCSSSKNTPAANKFEPRIDSIFSEFQTQGSPGCAVAVFMGDEIVFQKGYGLANIEHGVPISKETVFDIASVSKQFTAYAAAVLLEKGEVALTDDIKNYFPELQEFPYTITVDQLIHHTSGLRDWPQTLAVGGWSMEDELTYEQILRMAFAQKELNYEPGQEYTYTNTGYVLLAELVSRVTEEPFQDYIKKIIYDPLGMNSSSFCNDTHKIVPHRAQSYYRSDANSYVNSANNTTAMGSSSMLSTAEDVAKWLMFLARNKEMDPVVDRLHQRGTLNSGDTIHYAYGLWYEESVGLPVITHTGSWAGFRAITMRFPTRDFGFVILSNYGDFDRYLYAEKITKAFLQIHSELPEEQNNEVLAPTPAADISGLYLSQPTRIYELNREADALKLTIDGAIEYTLVTDSSGGYIAVEEPNLKVTRSENSLIVDGRAVSKVSANHLPLSKYIGTYFSDELQTTYDIREIDGLLVAQSLRHGPIPLHPIAGDVFEGGEWYLGRILFTTREAKISGFQVFGGRVRRLNFRKL